MTTSHQLQAFTSVMLRVAEWCSAA